MSKAGENVKWFQELSNKDISVAGGKGASLAEMINNKFPVPPGFVVTAHAYDLFIEKSGLKDKIESILSNIDFENTEQLEKAAKDVREVIVASNLPLELESEIVENYDILGTPSLEGATTSAKEILRKSKESTFVAVRSSATTEDLADASFAGQQESFLNVKGQKQLLEAVKKCIASLFTARAVYYRHKKGFPLTGAKLAVVVQKMVNSDKSGVMFSHSPVSDKDEIMIEAVFGLGEGIVSGMINPDNYIVSPEFKLLNTKLANKKIAIVRNASGENQVVKLNEDISARQVLSSYEIKILAQLAKKLEEHYKKPQDIEFAISGQDIYIVQSRPITTKFESSKKKDFQSEAILSGLGASPGISSGPVKVIYKMDDLSKIKKGDILVTEMTNPDMVVSMQKSAGIITDEGGITSHASIVSREMGIPCVVGTEKATKLLKDGDEVTVDGFAGKVYAGKGESKQIEIKQILPTKTKIKVIVDLPDYAERAAKTGAKAVGLVRLEGIIAESGCHPLYFVKESKLNEYTSLLVKGLSKIAEHFKEVWIRTSDIRSDEYRNLKGAPQSKEENPMLGDHGARFSLKHKDIMRAEVAAIKKIADKNPDKTFGIMVPQIISLDELETTKKIASSQGIEKGESNVKIGIMVETPAAVQIINELCESGLDFISFGTNDLTQYMLAIDRGNEEIQNLFNEMNPAVLSAISYVIRRCKKYGVETSICGQAASRPEMAEFLVKEGIDSVSVNADAAYTISEVISKIENQSKAQKALDPIFDGDSISKDIVSNNSDKIVDEDARVDVSKAIDANVEESVIQAQSNNLLIEDIFDMARSVAEHQDIQDVVLHELEASKHEKSDYSPGDKRSKEIPSLNDSIPVDSEQF